jgi:Phage Tail Collar Domain
MTYISDINPASPSGDDLLLNGDDQIRALKADLKNTLGGLNGPVKEDADTSGAGGTTLVSAATMSSWEARIKALEAGGGGGPTTGSIPVGGIMVWYGDVVTIPAGWKQCNGASYTYTPAGGGSATIQTPDLRGRTIFGPGAANSPGWNVGSTPNWVNFLGVPAIQSSTISDGNHTHQVPGGNYTLQAADLPSHTHFLFTDSVGVADASFVSTVARTRADPGDYDMAAGTGTPGTGISGTNQTGTPNAHSHGTATSTSAGAHTHTVGVNPPYLGLYHIMYVADGVPA